MKLFCLMFSDLCLTPQDLLLHDWSSQYLCMDGRTRWENVELTFLYQIFLVIQINGVIANADPFDIGDFLFNPVVLLVAAGRAVAQVKQYFFFQFLLSDFNFIDVQVVYFFSALGPLVYFALNIWPNIRPPKEETKSKYIIHN